jgi:protein-S-isoprenylcysteine O-methyltransferase Ste14
MRGLAAAGERPLATRTLETMLGGRHQSGVMMSRPSRLPEMASRAVIVAMFTWLAVRIGVDFLQTRHVTGLLLLASEALVVVLTVVRLPTVDIDRTVRARVLTVASLIGPLLVRPAGSSPWLLPWVSATLSAFGLLFVIGGKVSLGRSFGLMPANRGVVSRGLYRAVRHPIYLGYLICHVGFLGANPTLWNALTLVGADVGLLIRAVCEEETLSRDQAYRDYRRVVRWRIVPGMF